MKTVSLARGKGRSTAEASDAGGWTEFLHCDWPSRRTRKGLIGVWRNVWWWNKMSDCRSQLSGSACVRWQGLSYNKESPVWRHIQSDFGGSLRR